MTCTDLAGLNCGAINAFQSSFIGVEPEASVSTVEQTKAAAREGNQHILGTIALGVPFGLAVLNEFVTTDPGVPLARPRAGDIIGAALIGLIVAGVGPFGARLFA